MRVFPLIVSAVGLVGAVAAIAAAAYALRIPEPASDAASQIRSSVPQPAVPSKPPAPPPAAAPLAVSPQPSAQAARPAAPRPVAPSVIAVPPVDPDTLERVDPRPPLSELAAAAPPKKPPPKPLLFQPVAESAGVIVAGGRRIAISGVELVPDDATCERPGGTWPCGRAARTAFRAFLRGRAVTCDFPEGEVPDKLATTCRVGPRDIGGWLVASGWARARGDAYADEAKEAEAVGRGIHGGGPAALPAELAAPAAGQPPAGDSASEGPDDISILPDSSSTGATGVAAPPATLPRQSEEPSSGEGLNPLPPPSSPLR